MMWRLKCSVGVKLISKMWFSVQLTEMDQEEETLDELIQQVRMMGKSLIT
jgi:hypothetical protein